MFLIIYFNETNQQKIELIKNKCNIYHFIVLNNIFFIFILMIIKLQFL